MGSSYGIRVFEYELSYELNDFTFYLTVMSRTSGRTCDVVANFNFDTRKIHILIFHILQLTTCSVSTPERKNGFDLLRKDG